MTNLPFYVSPEQQMDDRAAFARKGIARGRSVIVLRYADGYLFVADNPSSTLHKVSELYDRIGFAAVGRYHEFEALRVAGIRQADLRGYAYDRRDVSGRALTHTYAQVLGGVFASAVEKPYEVELCVAEVGESPDGDRLYRITYDGSVADERDRTVIGGQADAIADRLGDLGVPDGLTLADALRAARRALGGLPATDLEVAVLDRTRPRRTFVRLSDDRVTALMEPS